MLIFHSYFYVYQRVMSHWPIWVPEMAIENITMENHHVQWKNQLSMTMFHRVVDLWKNMYWRLEVWNISYFSIYLGISSSQLIVIFFTGVGFNHQPVINITHINQIYSWYNHIIQIYIYMYIYIYTYIYIHISGWCFGTFLFSPILEIIIPVDFHIFQSVWNHQPVYIYIYI